LEVFFFKIFLLLYHFNRLAWDAIMEMRDSHDAPVDLVGAHTSGDASMEDGKFQILVGCFLSSQTKDQQTSLALQNLKKKGLTVDSVIEMTEDEIDNEIKMVGFHKTKAKFFNFIFFSCLHLET
jgi:endonuclease-3